MREPELSGIENELHDLARALTFPPTPDLRDAVRARLASPGSAVRKRPRRRMLQLAIGVLTLLAVLAVTPPGQAAVARLWDFAGVLLRHGNPTPTHGSGQLPGQSETKLDAAQRMVNFTLFIPTALATPDTVLISDHGRVVSLIYAAGPNRPPPDAHGVSVRIDEFDGDPVFQKMIFDSSIEVVQVTGHPALWIDGPHEVLYLNRNGGVDSASAHMAARTLIWQAGQVTLRMEAMFTKDAALRVAASAVPAIPPASHS